MATEATADFSRHHRLPDNSTKKMFILFVRDNRRLTNWLLMQTSRYQGQPCHVDKNDNSNTNFYTQPKS